MMRSTLDKNLLYVSIVLHVVAVVGLAIFYPDSSIKQEFLVFGAHSKYPSHAYFHRPKIKSGGGVTSSGKKGGVRHKSKAAVKKSAPKVKTQKQPSAVKKEEITTAMVKEKALSKKDKKHKKKAERKEQKKVEEKKVEKPKPEEIKKEEPVKDKPKKIEKPKEEPKPIKKVEEPKKVEQKPEPKTEEPPIEEVQEDATMVKSNEDPEGSDSLNLNADEEQMQFNLMGETDIHLLAYQQSIQHEVERLWQPPIGAPRGTECQVKFSIAKDGSVKEYKILKASQMVIYDLSIVRVAKNFVFDRILWGKSFTINFRQ